MCFIQTIMIFVGLSLDNFVSMMNKAATLRNVKLKDTITYAIIFATVSVLAVVLGFGVGTVLKGLTTDRSEVVLACLIIAVIGGLLIYRAFRFSGIEEKLDADFDHKSCLKMALFTNVDVLALAVGLSLFGISLPQAMFQAFVISFISTVIAIHVGYTQGSRFSKVFGYVGGILMFVLSIYLLLHAGR